MVSRGGAIVYDYATAKLKFAVEQLSPADTVRVMLALDEFLAELRKRLRDSHAEDLMTMGQEVGRARSLMEAQLSVSRYLAKVRQQTLPDAVSKETPT